MSQESERIKIVQYVKDEWNHTACPLKYPNQAFIEPTDKFFCHLLLLKGDDQRLTLGKDQYLVRCMSNMQIDIYGPEEKGESRHNVIVDLITSLFADKQMRTTDNQVITFRQPKRMTFGPRDGRYRVTVRVPYHRDEYRAGQ